ncbi:hypothetical protein CMK12_15910 [Candidatus Poribacteria bacterium]|nr:hypothetical protein [Candidatus Poribacteria bacterium]
MLAFLGVSILCSQPVFSQTTMTVEIKAHIDGKDILIIDDNTLRWHHLEYAAVGRHDGDNKPTIISTALNSVAQMNSVGWTPTWSTPPPDNIRQEEFSSIYSGLSPSLPNQDMTVSLDKIQVRENASISQQPNSGNGYQIKVTFDDKGAGGSADYHIRLNISYNAVSGEQAPVANALSVTTDANTPVAIVLSSIPTTGITYSIINQPSNGTLSGTAPNLTYTPNNGFSRTDTFTYKVNDGNTDSNTATVTIIVLPPNVAPVVNDQQVTFNQGQGGYINLDTFASDENGDNLTYLVVAQPNNGQVGDIVSAGGIGPFSINYSPNSDFFGTDTFTYKANDGKADSNIATVTIIVTEATFQLSCSWVTSNAGKSETNYARGRPTKCNSDEMGDCQRASYVVDDSGSRWSSQRNDPGPDQSNPHYVMVDLEQVRTVNKVVVDLGGHRQNFSVFTAATLGSWGSIGSGTDLSGTRTYEFASKKVRYIKFESYYSSDAGQVNVHQIEAYGPTENTEPNNPPVASAQTVTTAEDTAVAITLTATDADGDALTYTVVDQPSHGTLSLGTGQPPPITYTPNADYNGDDSFTFKVNDGTVDSATVTVSITVTAVDDPPVATAQSVIINEDTAVRIELHGQGTDVDNGDWGMLIWALVSEPNNGTLKKPEEDHGPYSPGTIYIPNTNYNGNDSFTFKVFNEQDSEPATVSVTVTAVNDLPVANDQSVEVGQNMPQHPITLSASDADGDSLTYLLVSNPSNGQLSGTPPNLTYTPNADYDGADSFTFKVNDGTVDSEPATVSITVTAVNDAPVAQDILIDDWFQPGMSVGINLLSTAC